MTVATKVCTMIGAVALGASVSTWATSAQAQARDCGGVYTVQRGDTLSGIAGAFYGNSRDFQIIYSANADTIGKNPGLIEIGMQLDIPCLDGQLAKSTADTSVITIERTTAALPAPNKRQIRIVTGTDWAPFTNEEQEQGGMVVEITNVALANADGKPDYKIDFINDWGAHLQPLISDHAYDFSLAWFRPNCDIVERLGEGSQFRCNNLEWSEPMFQQVVGYYTRAAEDPVSSYKQLFGRKVCRPAGYATFMLEEHNLVEPYVDFFAPNSPRACFEGLVDGTYDAVVLATDVAAGTISEIGANDALRMNEGLSQVLTMHAVISKTNPLAEQHLETLNNGLQKIKDNGEWFSIVRRHLAAHRAATQS